MEGRYKSLLLLPFIGLSVNANTAKQVYYSDKNITIYTDNTIVYTKSGDAPVFKPSSTWVEEDYFTQQAKYCEVDSIYGKKLNNSLVKNQNKIAIQAKTN